MENTCGLAWWSCSTIAYWWSASSICANSRAAFCTIVGSVPRGIDSMMLKASCRSPTSSIKVPPKHQSSTNSGGDGLHAATTPGDLDHHLRRTPRHRCPDAFADGSGTLSSSVGAPLALRLRLDNTVAWVEQPVTPFG